MSLPEFPQSPALTREEAVNQIISSIAMEELALSHIINAEGEKLQYVLGTLDGVPGPQPTIEQILAVNESIRAVLQSAAENQTLLRSKLQNVLSSSVLTGPPGPPGPAGTIKASGVQAELYNSGGPLILQSNQNILFNWISDNANQDISYDTQTGIFTINKTGKNSYYLINWWTMLEGNGGIDPVVFSININGTPYSKVISPYVQIQVSGSVLIPVNGGSLDITLTNLSTSPMSLAGIEKQANIILLGFSAA